MFDAWQDKLDVELGVAIKSGLNLTCAQYEGLRYCLSHEYVESLNAHQRVVLEGTGCNFISRRIHIIFVADRLIPTLPTIDVVRAWIAVEMRLRGLAWDNTKATLCPEVTMSRMIEKLPSGSCEGLYHFQLLADGVNVYRSASMCNVGLKLFDTSPSFNSLTSMTLL